MVDRALLGDKSFKRVSQGIYTIGKQTVQLFKTADRKIVVKMGGGYVDLEDWLCNQNYSYVKMPSKEEAMRDAMQMYRRN